ncbi:MAG TPA: hypothetical protein VG406_27715 [Isosphaeraceae bacterium]|nr:hypothetical protein [Isosphaeraceae bacterium]
MMYIGWYLCVGLVGAAIMSAAIYLKQRSQSALRPQIVGAELPSIGEGIDLTKRYDIVYGTSEEKLVDIRILGYLRSDRDQTTGEYMDSRWLVVELPDGRRAYLRPRSVLWLLEAKPAKLPEVGRSAAVGVI